MSLRYLLDTNIISDLVRRPRGKVASRIAEVGEDSYLVVRTDFDFQVGNRLDVERIR